jgi:hypothetical protein
MKFGGKLFPRCSQGDQKSLLQNRPKCGQPIFVKIDLQLLPWIKVAKMMEHFLYFSKNYPKKATARKGKNSPNLVTLAYSFTCSE